MQRAQPPSADADNEAIDFHTRVASQKAESLGPGGEAFNY